MFCRRRARRRRALGLERSFVGWAAGNCENLGQRSVAAFFGNLPRRLVAEIPNFYPPLGPFTSENGFECHVTGCRLFAKFVFFLNVVFVFWRERIWQDGGSDGNGRDESNELVQGRAAPGLWWLSRKKNLIYFPPCFPNLCNASCAEL